MTRAWWLYLGIGCASLVPYLFLPPIAQDTLYDAVAASTIVAIILAVRRFRGRSQRAWYVFAAAQFVYTLADILWNATNGIYGAVPDASYIDVLYLLYYPLVAIGLLMLVRQRGSSGHPAVVIDVVLIAVSASVVIWSVVHPSVMASDLTFAGRIIAVAYPVGDIVLIAMALRLAMGPGAQCRSLQFLLGSLFATAVADTLFMWASTTPEGYASGGPVDLIWFAGYLAFGTAALHPSMAELGQPGVYVDTRLGWRRIAMISAAIFAMPVGLLAALRASSSSDALAFVFGAITISMLLLVRIVTAMRTLEQSLERERALRTEAVVREEARRWGERRFRSIVYASSDVMLLSDPYGTITWCGDSIERICGYLPSELVGRRIVDFLHPEDVAMADYFTEALAVPGTSAWIDGRLRLSDGSYRIFQVTGRNLLDDPAVDGLLFTGLDVTERRTLSDQLIDQAFYDSLTGLANRALMIDRTERALARYAQDGRQAAILLIGLDNFKTVNDSLGHEAGDTVLQKAAERLMVGMRATDAAARVGGDEFAVLMDDAGTSQAFTAADRILGALAKPFTIGTHEVYVSASIGITLTDGEYADPDSMLRDANIAMHRAKSTGKNQRKAFRPSMRADAVRRLELHADLQRAMEREEFVVFYQPIVDLMTNRPAGFEALVRWRHPTHGIIGPDRFIPLAEETGLVVPLGRQILQQACLQATDWHSRFSPDLRMSVNLSAQQVADPRLVNDVEAVIRATNVDPSTLTLELTESALMADIELAAKRLKALRSLGIKIAIDDFGTGYSSMAYLDRLPIDLIKIDRSFVSALDDPTREPTLVRIMVDLAHRLGIPVVAEGIESPTQRERLQQLGCPLGQGYLFSPPHDAQTLEGILTDMLAVVR